MAYTLGQAAQAADVSKTTIRRAIAKGRISAARRDNGSYEIDQAELHRVYPPHGDSTATVARSVTIGDTDGLQREVELLRDVVGDLRRRLDDSEAERRQAQERLTALLTDQRPTDARRGWWPWRRR